MKKTEDKMPGGIVCGIVFAVIFTCIATGTLLAGIILTLIFAMEERAVSEMAVGLGLLGAGIVFLALTVVISVITDRKRKAWRVLHPLDKRTRRIRDRMITGYVFCVFCALAVAGFAPTTVEVIRSEGFSSMSCVFLGLAVAFLALSIFLGIIATRRRKALKTLQQPPQSQDVDIVATTGEGAETTAQLENEPNVTNASGGESLSKNGKVKFPDKAWFEQQGMPLKEIPIDKKQLKNGFSDDEKYILSVASFAVAKKKALIMNLNI